MRKHGLLGMKNMGIGNDERKAGIWYLERVGQMADKGDPPKIQEQTHPHVLAHMQMLFLGV